VDVRPGAIIGGKYRVERRLGQGGVGEVWAGEDTEGTKVAIKTLLPAASAHRELVTRFKREADFLARIRSQYVAKVVDFFADEQYGLVLILEFIDGEPMNELLRRKDLSIEEAIEIAWDVLGGLADLHREQIIHRDLKPGNVILRKMPNGRSNAVIVDFGMSRLTGVDKDGEEVTALTRVDIAVGTLEYMAPEQILDSSGVTTAADIYAIGAMLYRAVAGRHIFGELNDAVLARHKLINNAPPLEVTRTDPVARGFVAMVGRMLSRAPKERYQRAEDALEHLAVLRSGAIPPGLEKTVDSPVEAPRQSSPIHAPTPSNPIQPPQPSYVSLQPAQPSYVSIPHPSQPLMSVRSTSYDAEPPTVKQHRGGSVLLVLGIGALVGGLAVAGMLYYKREWPFVTATAGIPVEPIPITSASPPMRVLQPSESATPDPAPSASASAAPAVSLAASRAPMPRAVTTPAAVATSQPDAGK
jgi:serine/threonine protein kinase